MSKKKTISTFAKALKSLLDETGVFTRYEWSQVLRVSEAAISQWVNDKTIPRADILDMLFDAVSSTSDVPAKPLELFKDVIKRPSNEVSPFGERMMPTVQDYMNSPSITQLGRALQGRSLEEKKAIVQEGSWPLNENTFEEQSVSTHTLAMSSISHSLPDNIFNGSEPRVLANLISTRELGPKKAGFDELLSNKASLVVGGAGTGKTTMLEALHRRMKKEQTSDLLWLGSNNWNDVSRSNTALRDLKHASNNKLYIFVDGFDECPNDMRASLAGEINIAKERSNCQIIVSSRPTSELSMLQGLLFYEVAPMTHLQAHQFFVDAMARTRPQRTLTTRQFDKFICHFLERQSDFKEIYSPVLLNSIWHLFVRNSQTPFREFDGVERAVRCIIDELDAEKNLSRHREEWASTNVVVSLLGELCHGLVMSDKYSFTEETLARCLKPKFPQVPVREISESMENQGWFVRRGENFELAYSYFRDYFAARHIVEGSDSVSSYLKGWDGNSQLGNVVRIAAGLASDADDILDLITGAPQIDEPRRCLLLSQVLAQPIFANEEKLEKSGEMVVSALDKHLKDWKVEDAGAAMDTEASWSLSARSHCKNEGGDLLASTVAAVHQSRSGRAGPIFERRLNAASAPVLREFSASMKAEGRLHAEVSFDSDGSTMLNASVGSPQLV